MTWLIGLLVALPVAAFAALVLSGMHNLLLRQPRAKRRFPAWQDLGPTPLGEKRYTPQGMTFADGRIIFANSWRNTRSRVYCYQPPKMEPLAEFDMPAEAVHTSGLAWDGEHLWAVDYISNCCYQIDLAESLRAREARVVGKFPTGLKGTSACALLRYGGEEVLAISDFMRTRKTYLVRHRQAVANGTMAGAVVFAYTNEGFSQGLVWDGRHLYESENKRGVNVINQMDVDRLARTRCARASTVVQYDAPDRGVEDLAWDGQYMYTSDEVVFRFYRTAAEGLRTDAEARAADWAVDRQTGASSSRAEQGS
ncbi:MAG: hypothetical protein BWX88_01934 [Planctomycetes bacterium ADurb.Bin126]|nr:MAG: hypothetical protein BWX88_01934 [Planctomycetes bacterium ADurb.Bin126]HOD81549.1 hypothetical protein [Phycisphaerae bacterium]HQL72953.1 hypothetical protein [Phycisphaerae bacterium]